MEILVINGHDYTKFIQSKGYGWSRNDIDSEKTTRTKDGNMRRDKVTTKRKLSFTVAHMSRDELAQLDDDLSNPTFQATFYDLHGAQTLEFYCSSFSVTLSDVQDGIHDHWEAASFNMTEV